MLCVLMKSLSHVILKQKTGLKVSNFALLLVIFKWYGSEGVNTIVFLVLALLYCFVPFSADCFKCHFWQTLLLHFMAVVWKLSVFMFETWKMYLVWGGSTWTWKWILVLLLQLLLLAVAFFFSFLFLNFDIVIEGWRHLCLLHWYQLFSLLIFCIDLDVLLWCCHHTCIANESCLSHLNYLIIFSQYLLWQNRLL